MFTAVSRLVPESSATNTSRVVGEHVEHPELWMCPPGTSQNLDHPCASCTALSSRSSTSTASSSPAIAAQSVPGCARAISVAFLERLSHRATIRVSTSMGDTGRGVFTLSVSDR